MAVYVEPAQAAAPRLGTPGPFAWMGAMLCAAVLVGIVGMIVEAGKANAAASASATLERSADHVETPRAAPPPAQALPPPAVTIAIAPPPRQATAPSATAKLERPSTPATGARPHEPAPPSSKPLTTMLEGTGRLSAPAAGRTRGKPAKGAPADDDETRREMERAKDLLASVREERPL